jgi:hypothetical protein
VIFKMNRFVVLIAALPAISAGSNDAATAAADALGIEGDAADDAAAERRCRSF